MFNILSILFIIPLFMSFLIARLKKQRCTLTYGAFSLYITIILLNIFCFEVTKKSLINLIDYNMKFYALYIVGCFLLSWLAYNIYQALRTRHQLQYFRKVTLFFILLFNICFVYFMWVLGECGRQSFELFIFNLVTPVNSEVANFDIQLFGMIFFMLLLCISSIILYLDKGLFPQLQRCKRPPKHKRLFATTLPITLLIITILFPIYSFHLEDAYAYFNSSSDFVEKYYQDPKEVTMLWPEEKRNLIYVFMESFESSSFSKELGGLNNNNLLSNLTHQMQKGTSFSNHDGTLFGGLTTMPQASVTLSGMIASLSGVNNQVPADMSEGDTYSVVPYLTTLHDLLAEQGYQEYFISGTTVNDYHIGPFHRAHGSTNVSGIVEKKASGELPEDYKVWWGFEDKKLYEIAKEDLTNLDAQEEPFLYMISTNDTHRTGGYTDPSCPATDYTYPIENAIACSDYQISNFIDWVEQQPFYENTTIVIVGDHLAHKEDYTETLQPQEERRIFNLFINAKSPVQRGATQNRKTWAGDLFPTVLSAIGVEIEGNRLGLGTNLFSETPTLLEQYGETYVSQGLQNIDPYFIKHFLKP